MSQYPIELWTAALVATIVLIGGFSVFARWCLNSPAVRQDKLEALRVGMSEDEIKALLGEPRTKRHGDKGDECWVYGAQWKRHVLVVEMNRLGIVSQFVHGVPHLKKTKGAPEL
jgi:outer membrane protein assembly factor BamE (lipoprotein component of BamABCDE complex)